MRGTLFRFHGAAPFVRPAVFPRVTCEKACAVKQKISYEIEKARVNREGQPKKILKTCEARLAYWAKADAREIWCRSGFGKGRLEVVPDGLVF